MLASLECALYRTAALPRPRRPCILGQMNVIARELRESPLLWLLAAVPAVFVVEHLSPESHVALFALAVLAIVPLAALLSRATESVAAKTGDAVGGLLNATLGNLTEMVIAITALRAGMLDLVKASIAGAIMTNSLFMLGMALLLGGLKHRVQEYNRATARLQAGLMFLAAVALIIPSLVGSVEREGAARFTLDLSIGLAAILLVAYVLGLLFSLGTHKDEFAGAAHHAGEEEHLWPAQIAAALLVAVTVVVALVSEIFVESVQYAALAFGMTPAFVGFIIVSIVGAAAEMMAAFTAARKNRLDMSVGIALGSSAQIALFVAPVLVLASLFIAPVPMDLQFWPGAVVAVLLSTLIVVFVTSSGRSAWYVGVMLLVVYAIFAITLYLMPPATA
jgi:Ca2+:H+ antiporter